MPKKKNKTEEILPSIDEVAEDGRAKAARIQEERDVRMAANVIGPVTVPISEVISPSTTTNVGIQYIDSNTREVTIRFQVKTNVMKEDDIVDEVQGVLLGVAPQIATMLKEVITVEDDLIAATKQK